MTLTNRLTVFTLVALGIVLIALSTVLFFLMEGQLLRRIEERAEASLDTLVAAAETEPDGLEWNPNERTILPSRGADSPVWAVFDATGEVIDGDPDSVCRLRTLTESGTTSPWRLVQRIHTHPTPGIPDRRTRPGGPRHRDSERYGTLHFVLAVSTASVAETLDTLRWSLIGVSLAVWLAAGFGIRRLCRQALAPVVRMAEAFDHHAADRFDERLPVPDPPDELRRLTLAFNGLLDRVKEAYERQKGFTAEASHQLRTPLTALRGQMEIALRRDREPEEYRRVLTAGVGQTERLRKIVEALLYLARADAEARLPQPETIDLSEWLPHQLQEAWGDHPRFADLQFHVTSGIVRVDSLLFGQAMDNLVENAFKYSPSGSTVRVESRCKENEVEIVVEDEGPGIASEDRGRIFEPFFRSGMARRRGIPGVGLGLAVTARIVAAFGGRIEVISEEGQGTRFTLWLPASEEEGASPIPSSAIL